MITLSTTFELSSHYSRYSGRCYATMHYMAFNTHTPTPTDFLLSFLRPVTTSICPGLAILRTFCGSLGYVGGMVSQSSHASSRNWKNCSRLLPSLRQDAQVSRSARLRFVPRNSLACLHHASIVSARTPSRSTAIFNRSYRDPGNV